MQAFIVAQRHCIQLYRFFSVEFQASKLSIQAQSLDTMPFVIQAFKIVWSQRLKSKNPTIHFEFCQANPLNGIVRNRIC